ncbi:hypothetical protein GDO81_030044 [Engystomops pustulosus]|uniref:Peroxisomal membrane protein 11B n=2 Tax=Engystomops pustulosus TaxID=76066 RepID=A0AAV6YGZ2_ENGPU|nr:hypothetical protein GDO81_030044 [Engystomops pustulosus]
MNLTRDLYEIKQLMESESGARRCSKVSTENGAVSGGPRHHPLALRLRLVVHILRTNPPLLLDLLKNCCDLFIPLDKLGLYKSNAGVVGLCGLTSSILSILTILHPWLKLKP